jgi:hypothetical protein
MFNSRQYEWADLSILIGGNIVTGARAISYKSTQEKEVIYAKGNEGHSIQRGNVKHEGEITMLQSEYEKLCLAGGGSILSMRVNINVNYGDPIKGDKMTTDVVEYAEFTEEAKEMKQGDKNMEVKIPFIALRIVRQKI